MLVITVATGGRCRGRRYRDAMTFCARVCAHAHENLVENGSDSMGGWIFA